MGASYYRAGYYDPTSGRFISEDPMQLSAAGVNFYAYVTDSPLNFSDPSGMCPEHQCAGSGSAPPPEFYAQLGQDRGNWFVNYNFWSALGFHSGGFLDAQVQYGGSPAYANYVYGVYMASAGYSLPEALAIANGFATMPTVNSKFPFFHNRYSSKHPPDYFDPKYRHDPRSNVANITAGFNDERNGTLCTIN